MKTNKIIIITGPTAVGKTAVSIELAKRISGEIISADSMQIYKYMDIGTAKIQEAEMEGIPHHLIDFLKPDEDFSVSNYKTLAENKIVEIQSRGNIPIVVGGTGLYINSLIYKLDFNEIPSNNEYREELEAYAEEFGNEALYNKYIAIDPAAKDIVSFNNRKRIIRALEVYQVSGKKMSQLKQTFRVVRNDLQSELIFLSMEREALYDRINLRVDKMMKAGFVDEVKNLLEMGYGKELKSMEAIGYKQIISYLEGCNTLDQTVDKIKQLSRNYAKRQFTWFRREEKVKWIDVGELPDASKTCDKIYNLLRS